MRIVGEQSVYDYAYRNCRCTHEADCPEHPGDDGPDAQHEQHHDPTDHVEE